MAAAQRMGEYLRYRGAIGARLTELAILLTARHWDQQVEWAIHAPLAAASGIAPDSIAAIAARRRPSGMADDEALVHDFCLELQQRHCISDATYAHALALFGEQGVVDLAGLIGYYTLLAMVMNMARTAAPPSAAAPLPE